MESHGVTLSAEEEKRIKALPEERMIDALVMRMPQQSREQFEHFFLQLSFIASTTTRLRTALEGGQPDVIEEALDSAENVGVLPYIMKMAVAQAGSEVKNLTAQHDAWLMDTDAKMAPLLQTAAGSDVRRCLSACSGEQAWSPQPRPPARVSARTTVVTVTPYANAGFSSPSLGAATKAIATVAIMRVRTRIDDAAPPPSVGRSRAEPSSGCLQRRYE